MVHIFEPPIQLRNAPDELKPKSGQKRKRDIDHSESDSLAVDAQNDSDSTSASPSDDEPDKPAEFPHAPLKSDFGHAHLQTPHRNLKQQHFHVLNAILHRCLLDHDYARAGNAMACLLRLEMEGRYADLRKKGLWGIGAEILLRKPDILAQDAADEDWENDLRDPGKGPPQDVHVFSQTGFRAAKQYYDRLILQYPHKKTRPQDVSAQQFYPAMFSLWVFQVHSQSQLALKGLERQSDNSMDFSMETTSVDSTRSDYEQAQRTARERDIRTTELEQARQIASALGELTTSPPYDREAGVLKLQGRVACWVMDLLKVTASDSKPDTVELQRVATEAFQRAQDYGAKLSEEELNMCEV